MPGQASLHEQSRAGIQLRSFCPAHLTVLLSAASRPERPKLASTVTSGWRSSWSSEGIEKARWRLPEVLDSFPRRFRRSLHTHPLSHLSVLGPPPLKLARLILAVAPSPTRPFSSPVTSPLCPELFRLSFVRTPAREKTARLPYSLQLHASIESRFSPSHRGPQKQVYLSLGEGARAGLLGRPAARSRQRPCSLLPGGERLRGEVAPERQNLSPSGEDS